MQSHEEMKESVVLAGKQMVGLKLVSGTWGNISICSDDRTRIAVTPSGHPYNELTPADIVIVDGSGTLIEGTRPSSELPLHLAIYSGRQDVRAVVHTHSLYATACAVAGEPIPPSLEELVQVVGGGVNVANYALPGTSDLANNALAALGDRTAVLLANHGAVACGPSLKEALLIAELVEKAAQIHAIAVQLGGSRRLSDHDVQLMRSFYVEKYRQPLPKGRCE